MNTLLALFYYFYFSVVGVYVIFIPKVLSGVGYSGSEIGILLGAAPLVRFVLPFLFFKGLKLGSAIFHIALVVMALSSVLFYAALEHFYPLLFSNVLLGVGMSLVLPYIEVIALQSIGKERYGKVRLFGSLGFIVVALILSRFSIDGFVSLYFLIALSFLSALLGYMVQRASHKLPQTKAEERTQTIPIVQEWMLWAGLMLMQVSFGSFYNFFTIYATDHGIALDMTVYLWSFGVIVEVVMLFFQGRLLASFELLHLIMLSVFATIGRWYLVCSYADNLTILFLSQSIHALSFALFHSASISYLHQRYENKHLAQQLFLGFTYGLGGVVGSVIAGYVYEWYPKYLFLSSSAFALMSFVLLFGFALRARSS